MSTRPNLPKMLLSAALLCLLLGGSVFGAFRAAVAVRDVTPEKLLPVSGGVGASQPVTRKIGQLTVRALVLESGGTRVAICSTDFLGFPGVLCNRVRSRVQGIPAQNILIGATHCHSAPDCYGFPDRSGKTGADLEYIESVCVKLAEAINEAVDHLQPAKVKIATGKAQGKIAYNYYAEKLYDPRCHVIQVLERRRHAGGHARQLRLSPGDHRAGSGHPVPGFRRAALRPDQRTKRRHRPLHEQRPGRHGDRRLSRPRRQGHPDVGGMYPHRPAPRR